MTNHSRKILVVDDYNTMVRIIRNLLKQIGYHDIDDACEGAAALEMMRAKPYDLVICDWNMEPMTGFDVLLAMRKDTALKSVPFIMVTAESRSEHVQAAKGSGANGYVVKPFNAGTLKNKIDQVFETIAATGGWITRGEDQQNSEAIVP